MGKSVEGKLLPSPVVDLEPQVGPLGLVPLPSAAELLYLLVHGAPPPEAHLVERLNGLAYTLADETALFAVDGDGVRPIPKDGLVGGFFCQGAQELQFLDERPPVRDIRVTRDGVERTAARLINAIDYRSRRPGRSKAPDSVSESASR